MDSLTYIPQAIRTESVPASIEIDQLFLHTALRMAVDMSTIVDQVKRKIFYGKNVDIDKLQSAAVHLSALSDFLIMASQSPDGIVGIGVPQTQEEVDEACQSLSFNMKLEHLNVRLLHAALGCYTESGELVEAMLKQYETGNLDLTNFGEEIGDIEWYQAIGFNETGVTEAHCREKNIAKLRKRYPEKFDADQAVNRDLAGERVILESGSKTTPNEQLTEIFGAAPLKQKDETK